MRGALQTEGRREALDAAAAARPERLGNQAAQRRLHATEQGVRGRGEPLPAGPARKRCGVRFNYDALAGTIDEDNHKLYHRGQG